MQVLCMASNDHHAPVACPTCGQGYNLYYSRPSIPEREMALIAVLETLVAHHAGDPTPAAHRNEMFNVPAWSGPAHMSAAALLSGAPVAPHQQMSEDSQSAA